MANHSRPTSRDTSSQQFFPKCYHDNTSTMGATTLCYNFLNRIGQQECLVWGGNWTTMCNSTMGTMTAYVRGQAAAGVPQTSSPCFAIARGMDWIMEMCPVARCSGDGCVVGGTNAAWGNGDLTIEVVGNDTQRWNP